MEEAGMAFTGEEQEMSNGPAEEVLVGEGLGKRYGVIEALTGVDIRLRAGQITAICGDNGAGKSTLVKLLSGAGSPTAGTLRLRGEEVRLTSPRHAREVGIETVYQDLGIAPH